MCAHLVRFLFVAFAVFFAGSLAAGAARADALGRYLVWSSVAHSGYQMRSAVNSFFDLQDQRALWRENVATAKAELERCGGCASAQRKLDYWQGTETTFNTFVGGVLQQMGYPPIVGQWLGVPMGGVGGSRKMPDAVIETPSWLGELTPPCRAAVEEHIACLRGFVAGRRAQGLSTPIASLGVSESWNHPCYEQSLLYGHCARKDYVAFEREVEVQKARAAGLVIAQLASSGPYREVYYGKVAEDFVPTIPVEVVREALGEKDAVSIQLITRKERPGSLERFRISKFNEHQLLSRTRCSDGRQQRPELERRVCEDLHEMRYVERSELLYCHYIENRTRIDYTVYPFAYWYGDRPATAAPERLLSRAGGHPLAQVGDARTSCPATLDEANRINQEYSGKLGQLASRTPQIPESQTLPKSAILAKIQEEHDARHRQWQRAAAALPAFPLEGIFRFEKTVRGTKTAGECMVVRLDQSLHHTMRCIGSDGREFAAGGLPQSGSFGVDWPGTERADAVIYLVDLAAKERGEGDILVGNAPAGQPPIESRLVRKGDLTKIGAAPIEGDYDLTLSVGGTTVTAPCTLEPHTNTMPPRVRFELTCSMPDGRRYARTGSLREADSGAISFNNLFDGRRPFQIGGQNLGLLYFFVDPAADPRRLGEAALVGYVEQGGKARLTRSSGARTAALAPTQTPTVTDTARTGTGAATTSQTAGGGLTGRWVGGYSCGQGRTALELTIQDLGDGAVWARFAFSPPPENPSVPRGAFLMHGTYDAATRLVRLAPGPWIDRPAGWTALPMSGTVTLSDGGSGAGDRLTGPIHHAACGPFDVRRVDRNADGLGPMPEAIRAALGPAAPARR